MRIDATNATFVLPSPGRRRNDHATDAASVRINATNATLVRPAPGGRRRAAGAA